MKGSLSARYFLRLGILSRLRYTSAIFNLQRYMSKAVVLLVLLQQQLQLPEFAERLGIVFLIIVVVAIIVSDNTPA